MPDAGLHRNEVISPVELDAAARVIKKADDAMVQRLSKLGDRGVHLLPVQVFSFFHLKPETFERFLHGPRIVDRVAQRGGTIRSIPDNERHAPFRDLAWKAIFHTYVGSILV